MARTKINNKKLQTYIGAKFQQGGTFESITQDLITLGITPKQSEKEVKGFMQSGGYTIPNYGTIVPLGNRGVGSSLVGFEDRQRVLSLGYPYEINKEKFSRKPYIKHSFDETVYPTPEEILEKYGNKEGKPKVNKNSTPQKVGKTVSQVWIEKTGLPWAEAKKLGVTDGSKTKNLELLKKLNLGEDVLPKRNATTISGNSAGLQEWTGPKEVEVGYFGKTNLSPTMEQLMQGKVEEVYQRGGEIEQQQIQEEVIAALQNGAQPQDIVERLIQMGVPADEAQVFVQEMMQVVQQQAASSQQFQEGGEMQDQIMQAVMQALQGGAQPEEVVQFLVEQGIPEEQAVQVVEQVMQQSQGQQFQEGGEMQDQIMQGIMAALQEGEDANELIQYLSNDKGIPVKQAQVMVEQAIQTLQGAQ